MRHGAKLSAMLSAHHFLRRAPFVRTGLRLLYFPMRLPRSSSPRLEALHLSRTCARLMNFISDVFPVQGAPISCMATFRFELAARSGGTTGDGRAADVCKGSHTQVFLTEAR